MITLPSHGVSIPEGPNRLGGFTLAELVATMVVVGILAAVALPKFSALTEFDAAGYGNQLKSLFQYGQKVAIAQRRQVAVEYSAASAQLCSFSHASPPSCPVTGFDCLALGGTLVTLPAGDGSFLAGPSGVVTPSVMCFDATGAAYAGAGTIAVAGANSIQVEAATGYVR